MRDLLGMSINGAKFSPSLTFDEERALIRHGQEYDRYISESWFLRDKLNLEAEALAQLKTSQAAGDYDWYKEEDVSKSARLDYVSERLRLLYVGITRAKRDLVITWNTGRKGDMQSADSLTALIGYWEKQISGLGGGTA